MIVILDTNVLSLLTAPINEELSEDEQRLTEVYQCTEWFYHLLARGAYVTTSDISDYEVRRELIRIESKSVEKLDQLRDLIEFQAVTFSVLRKAAEIWAESRSMSQPNKVIENIDVDCIIAAQWRLLNDQFPGRQVIIATKNIRDFQRTTECSIWQEITYL